MSLFDEPKKACIWAASIFGGAAAIIAAYHGFVNWVADEEEVAAGDNKIKKELIKQLEDGNRERAALIQAQEIANLKSVNDEIRTKIRFWQQEKKILKAQYPIQPYPQMVSDRIEEIDAEIHALELLLKRNG